MPGPRTIRTLQHVGRILENIEEDEGNILCECIFTELLLMVTLAVMPSPKNTVYKSKFQS